MPDPATASLASIGEAHASAGRFAEARDSFAALLAREPANREARLRLYELEQILGNNAQALAYLDELLAEVRIITMPARIHPPALTVLALYRSSLWEGNLPLELIVDLDRTTLHRLYVGRNLDDDRRTQMELPFDVLFNAIAESDAARPALQAADEFVARLGVPCINRPSVVMQMGRESVAARFADSQTVLAPPVARVRRAELETGTIPPYPFLLRPIGSQAGVGLAKIDDVVGLHTYLAGQQADEFYRTDFIDYKLADGCYRKYRIMFVRGVAFPYHLAVSPNWMIHYYNAPMFDHAWMRDEEERFVDDISAVFGGIRAEALAEIAAKIDLEYFGIDCSVAPDGRLLLFEADSAMLVHGTDPPELFRYKKRAFENVQRAFNELIEGTAAVS
jgi:hypothetical protein